MVGRSNVGKSSFINGLLQRRVARTSNTPGKTRLMNFYVVRGELHQRPLQFTMVDLPGYGYAKLSQTERARWGKVLERFLMKRESLCRVVHLVDVRHGMLDNDLEMHQWLVENGFKVWLVLTKTDKLSRSQAAQKILALKKSLIPSVEEVFSFSTTAAPGQFSEPSGAGTSLGGCPAGREPFMVRVAEQVWAWTEATPDPLAVGESSP